MFEELKQMNDELEALKKAHLEKSKVLFTDVSKKVFDAHPALKSFGWRQYTPYFNDGNECTFWAHTDEPDINDVDGYDVDFQRKTITNYHTKEVTKNENYNLELSNALTTVKEFLSNIKDEVLRDLFGDHVHIKVTPEGTEVEEYEHD